jgi:hypothetical protein
VEYPLRASPGGYHLAFVVGAVFVVIGIALPLILLRP